MNKILTISAISFAAIGLLFLMIGLFDGNVISMAGSGSMATGFLAVSYTHLTLPTNREV